MSPASRRWRPRPASRTSPWLPPIKKLHDRIMIATSWGPLAVADAHVHFFSHGFFASLAEQKGVPTDQLAPLLNWQMPAEDPRQLADGWARELDKYGVAKASLIAS